jgi:predicted secreted protein
MGLVLGKDVILSVSVDNALNFKPIGCARSVTLELQKEFIEISGPNSGVYRGYIPSAITCSGTMEGVVLLGSHNSPDIHNLGNIYQNLLDQKLNMRFYMQDEGADYYFEKSLDVYIESISETSSFDNITTFSINFKGTGPITIDYGEIL